MQVIHEINIVADKVGVNVVFVPIVVVVVVVVH